MDEFLHNGSIISLGDGRLLIGYGKRIWSKNPRQKDFSFYAPDFFLKSTNPWFFHEFWEEISCEELRGKVQSSGLDVAWTNPYRAVFRTQFAELQKLFSKKKLVKAVPYVFEESSTRMSEGLLAHLLFHLSTVAETYPVHLYGFWNGSEGILGATPEILFACKNQRLHTMACAGTAAFSERSLLLHDPKLLQEHQVVVEAIRESLNPFGKVSAQEMRIVNAPGLAHLLTLIEVQLSDATSFDDIVRVLHPTPALGAYPMAEGRKWLLEYETKVPRKRFGAPIGVLMPNGEMQCLVGIRNVQWEDKGMRIGAGVGVIESSDLEKEWQEIELKLKAIKKQLSLGGNNASIR